ncbi:hypothetical protein D9X30_3194 [Cupriavidus sp. U2]|nr:hypothetical protein D9X30_3194 [Cupriavidus sp. U2]
MQAVRRAYRQGARQTRAARCAAGKCGVRLCFVNVPHSRAAQGGIAMRPDCAAIRCAGTCPPTSCAACDGKEAPQARAAPRIDIGILRIHAISRIVIRRFF